MPGMITEVLAFDDILAATTIRPDDDFGETPPSGDVELTTPEITLAQLEKLAAPR